MILKKPLLTEKFAAMNEVGKYAFEVNIKANKVEIKKAVEKLYGVTVEKVATMKTQGKVKSKYTKSGAVTGRTSSKKKAIVTLKEGEVIDFYSSI
ncbi:50S ribosomal protein L23 [Pontibacter indicus]|jgi:large subunit ribosomal protein L23|uniref:Large ribosomal subunit protein uL23 n=6 Tax=Hymenobacteraceae TaxID=1853232 RepID=A0A1N6TUV8_9BACT|nr:MULTISPECIES: 50S ribosomal protein L23 [Pontibacter]EJF10863.1 50S ribosomal protein L23 [Pontibacter sp. BAB1700]PKV66740.1 large subunit ribosomal protein L23 [Pontibacter ramchanderi]PVY43923.1 large subunit ribosomal protein L23 [Pontibacter virosus]SIQ57113.1 large subunit ribosomal protein L23 [Pontibacter lucknowensis]GGG16847.1 50S ribosomal protein L23 [Pontibacter amylolyticus]